MSIQRRCSSIKHAGLDRSVLRRRTRRAVLKVRVVTDVVRLQADIHRVNVSDYDTLNDTHCEISYMRVIKEKEQYR